MYFGYARVSSKGQKDTSIEVQLRFLEEQAKALNVPFVRRNEKASGKDIEGREVFSRLLKEVRENDIVGVYDNTRFGRNVYENIIAIHQLTEKGARVHVGGIFVDTEDPTSIFTFHVESAVNS